MIFSLSDLGTFPKLFSIRHRHRFSIALIYILKTAYKTICNLSRVGTPVAKWITNRKLGSTAKSLILSPSYRPDIIEILLKTT